LTVFEENKQLLNNFRQGTAEALSAVYLRYVDDVAAVLRRGFMLQAKDTRVPGVPSAETERDLVQEVFVRAFAEKARRAYDGLRPYRPYLIQIAKNLLVDYFRKQGREFHVEQDDQLDRIAEPESSFSPEEQLHWKTMQSATKQFVSGLDSKLQQFVRLRFEEEKSQYEIMDIMGLSRWRVRALEKKVLAGLKRQLKKLDLLEG